MSIARLFILTWLLHNLKIYRWLRNACQALSWLLTMNPSFIHTGCKWISVLNSNHVFIMLKAPSPLSTVRVMLDMPVDTGDGCSAFHISLHSWKRCMASDHITYLWAFKCRLPCTLCPGPGTYRGLFSTHRSWNLHAMATTKSNACDLNSADSLDGEVHFWAASP